jgi:hypothetical protein
VKMQAINYEQDLVTDACPLGCQNHCPEVWINKYIGHRIICQCKCHIKRNSLDRAKDYSAASTKRIVTKSNYIKSRHRGAGR